MIGVINYGVGNIMSIINMFRKLDITCIQVSEPDEIAKCDKLILPGVGSFDHGMKSLIESGLVPFIDKHVQQNKPLLGICLGMQMLGLSSEEGKSKGLGYIKCYTKKFDSTNLNKKVPHMGWNNISYHRDNSKLLINLEPDARYYFVHSYYVICEDESNITLKTDYYGEFVSGIESKNVYGVQFHPEKSHKYGMTILKNFARID